MSGVVLYKADDWYEYSDWFKQRPPPAALRSRVRIPYCHLLWGASRHNEFHPRIIQSAFEHGQWADQLGMGVCPYRGALAAAWLRGYYYASRHAGSATHIHPSPCLPTCEWKRLREPVRLNTSPKTVPQVISEIDNLSSDIDYLGSEWGRWMRSEPNPWYRENHINRLFEASGNHYKARVVTSDNLDANSQNSYQSGTGGLGRLRNAFRDFRISASGASADTYGALGHNSATGLKKNYKVNGPKILTDFMSKDQLIFHRGYRKLKKCQKAILWTHFVPEVTQERKLNLLKFTQVEYDRLLGLALKAVAKKIGVIDEVDALIEDVDTLIENAEALIKRKAAPKQTSQDIVGPLWPSRIFSYVHKVAINDSRRNPFPICLDKNGHYNPQSPFVEGPIDSNVYCLRQDGEPYAVVSTWKWVRFRSKKRLDSHLAGHRDGALFHHATIVQERPIRILRQTRKGQWLVGKVGNLKHIRKLRGLEHIAIAGKSPGVDALRAIWGTVKPRAGKNAVLDEASGPIYLDNDAYLPACSSQESFDQKAMRGYTTCEGVKIIGIQDPGVQFEIGQKLTEFEEKISEAQEQGLTDLCEQDKKDMKDFKSLTKGSCMSKTASKPIDDGDIFRSVLNNLRQRRTSALHGLRKAGLHDEADDLDNCYKIENRTAIVFASRSIFTWKFDRE